jgi:RNA-directed DNA polymerase
LIRLYLRSGVIDGDGFHETLEGTVQGGPISPLLANLVLDDLDKELEQRGHHFVRYADDCNIYVNSRRAGNRVMASLTRFLDRRLKLQINEAKSAVDRPWNRKFLGFSFTRRDKRRKISLSAIKRLKDRVRELTTRTRGRSLRMIIGELGNYLKGWLGYFGFTETRSMFKELDSWIRRRLRSYVWKQWGRRGYKELRKRGVSRTLAWNTAKSAHGPWRISRSPALTIALGFQFFTDLGLPLLYKKTLW